MTVMQNDLEGAWMPNGRRKCAYIRLSEDSLKGVEASTEGCGLSL